MQRKLAQMKRPDDESAVSTAIMVQAGNQFGPYRIEQQIGSGGMGEVFRAIDTRLGRTVALKTCRAQFTARFNREARAISSLNHPNICALYDVGPNYLVMEYVAGPTLAELIRKGPLAEEDVRRIAVEIAEAIEAAHDHGIVHRDLKPANIKLTASGAVKVLDFGLAKATAEPHAAPSGDITHAGTILGTPPYMSPEQALGGQIDRRSDIWSFGVLLMEMLTGKRPFTGRSTDEVLSAIVMRNQPDWSTVPERWIPLLRRCLTKEVRRRLQAIGEARLAIEGGLPAPPAAAAKRSRWPFAIAAGALVIGAGLGWLASGGKWKHEPENPLAGAKFTRITDFPGAEMEAEISPDGRFLAFLSDRDGPFDIFLTQPATARFTNLTQGKYGQLLEPTRSTGFSGDGTQIWLRGAGSDERAGTLARLMPILGGPPRPFVNAVSVSWSPDGSKIAYHQSDGDPIFVADSNGGNPKQIFRDPNPGGHCHFPIWSPDGQWIYFVRGNPTTEEMDLWRILPAGGEPERITARKVNMMYPAFINADTVLYVAPAEDGSGPWLYSLDIRTRQSRRIAYGLEQYTSIAASANGRRLVATVANPSVGLWTIPFVTDRVVKESEVKRMPVPSVRALAPRYGGKDLFYLSSLGGGDGLWRFSGGEESQEIWKGTEGALREAPAISPDGARAAILLRREGRVALHFLNADGTSLVAGNAKVDVRGTVAWSPDGKWIAAGGVGPAGPGLYKIAVDGGDPIRIHQGIATDPVWSADNALVAFTGASIGRYRPLLAVHPDGSAFELPDVRIAQTAGERFRFSPDSKAIVFIEGQLRLRRTEVAGPLRQTTCPLTQFDSRAAMRTFDFTPDGKQIVFDRLFENSDIMMVDLP